MEKVIVNGGNAILGRMSSFVAKELLKGKSVDVINSDKVIISGDGKVFAKKIKEKRDMGSGGSLKGPKYSRVEDRLLKRIIRGMLPRDRSKGREAFKRLKCHIGNESVSLEGKEVKTFEHRRPRKYSTMTQIVRMLK